MRRALGTRTATVLRAVVRDYIRTAEPVGSGTVVARYHLGVSPATIRNDMSLLEELGYVQQPHTSAGRVPTDLGYRFYVDTLPHLPPLSAARRRAIAASIDRRAADIDEVMRKTAHVLSRITHYAAVALPPAVERRRILRAEVVMVGSSPLLVVVSETGRVDKRVLDPEESADDTTVAWVSETLEGSFVRLSSAQAQARATRLSERVEGARRALLASVAEAFADLGREPEEDRVFIGGVANIAGEDAFERRETVRRVFEALDEESTILRFLRGLATGEVGGRDVIVRIGRENPLAAMREASVVVARYAGGDPVGAIALIGPTRMEYPSAMSTVGAVARRLSALFEGIG